MDFAALYDRYAPDMEDFWARRRNRPRFTQEFRLFGRSVRLSSNDATVLTAGELCRPLYSKAPLIEGATTFNVQLIVQEAPKDPGLAPEDLFTHILYAGDGDWLGIHLGAWGHCQVELSAGRALAVLTPQLASRPEVVGRCLLNTVFTNLFIASGLGMLHATCLVRGDRALLLMAPHNSGKSTTALRLVLSGGYALMSDSQVYIQPGGGVLQLMGFPVGRVKLRPDMLANFPQLHPLLAVEPVRGETKYSLDLRELRPELVREEAIVPSGIDLCLLTRNGLEASQLVPMARAEVEEAVMANSLYYDTELVWRRNLASIQPLIEQARCHRLILGSSPEGIFEAVARLGEAG